ncbi:Ubiquitin carboxyl-terminal hydrolase MINDY-1 [Euphorbia peplus]|nr:Ubiquitin carboxyl-terminal hydrolase MINDY-1 [Euphorbia peplus]
MAAAASSSCSEEQQNQVPVKDDREREKECLHRTKTIQFLGRNTPIVLQNDNGPCPLLAICNVLSLRNNLNLSPDIAEVSQEKLLSLVAERLIDSNSNVNNKDEGYVENQQQNIADAIDLLPRLATGIDVNIKFRRIDDFEFTPECAIFDLLDIPLYHGWIVDPQDYDTANAVGSKSYNSLTGELVALDTQVMESENKSAPEEDSVDFAAATAATLGVPSPSLSKTRSFDSPRSISDHESRKGDLEEEAELLRAIKMSESATPTLTSDVGGVVSAGPYEDTCSEGALPVNSVDLLKGITSIDNGDSALSNTRNHPISLETSAVDVACSPSTPEFCNHLVQSTDKESAENISYNDANLNHTVGTLNNEGALPLFVGKSLTSVDEEHVDITPGDQMVKNQLVIRTNSHEPEGTTIGHDTSELSGVSTPTPESDTSSGRLHSLDVPDVFSVDGSEPIYEGEECILDPGTPVFDDGEPMYEGEVVLAEQGDKTVRSKDEITPQQGELIRNFLKNNASQLTFYGLFCLQDGLKERELCVFFRNNHFCTMFKYDGELYLLATDQGYLNQPDLVWEKLNEVNGDTLFMTGNFKEFKVENHSNDAWDENNAMANTADYIASIDSAAEAGLDINSDLQLAIALQQQEFEQQQPPQQQRQNPQQPASTGSSRLVTGPQVPRTSAKYPPSSSRPEAKSKDKCIVM